MMVMCLLSTVIRVCFNLLTAECRKLECQPLIGVFIVPGINNSALLTIIIYWYYQLLLEPIPFGLW